ncbi:phosphopentomutase [Vibrio sp.]|uniref:phosphopentomutase n=1 Tax=Vibrio sp. TaxID=678 RepID=UPI003AA8A634
MGRFIVVVLDGFGVGEMDDVKLTRTQDIGSNTAYKLLNYYSDQDLPVLGKLGLNNVVKSRTSVIKKNRFANTGTINLKHEGCDTFAGHQELMGTLPKKPLVKPFYYSIDAIENALLKHGYQVERVNRLDAEILFVNQCVMVGDNLEAELGQVYNITANLNLISFDELQILGTVIRGANNVSRNVVFGGLLDSNQSLFDAIEVRGKYIGVNAPRSGAYDKGFQVVHLGYGVDHSVQAPQMINQNGVKTILIGKVADIVQIKNGVNFVKMVDTDDIFERSVEEIKKLNNGFFCINIQETDLSGHKENSELYWSTLQRADEGIGRIISLLNKDDILIITADHGNDPFIGHGMHTRERVPLLLVSEGIYGVDFGERGTLADIGATVCDYFNANPPEFGTSFLSLIHIKKNISV